MMSLQPNSVHNQSSQKCRIPVVVTKILASFAAASMVVTSNPSITACRALMGSTSVIMTREPIAFSANADPFPTSPYPATIGERRVDSKLIR